MIRALIVSFAILALALSAFAFPLGGSMTLETTSNPSTLNDAVEFDLSSNAEITALKTEAGGDIDPADYTITTDPVTGKKKIQFTKNQRKKKVQVVVEYTGSDTPTLTNSEWKDNLANPAPPPEPAPE